MLFFNLSSSQKSIFALVLGTVFFMSCSGPKKVTVSKDAGNTTEKITKKDDDRNKKAPDIVDDPIEETEEHPDKKGKSSDKAEKVISTARTFIGTPYKYGGMTRTGMDCSGLLINS